MDLLATEADCPILRWQAERHIASGRKRVRNVSWSALHVAHNCESIEQFDADFERQLLAGERVDDGLEHTGKPWRLNPAESLGKNRIIADALEVPRRAPDIILGSWCGKKFQPGSVKARPGWSDVPAIRNDFVREIKSSLILQPGPAALTDGIAAVQQVVLEWAASVDTRGR